MTTDTPTEAAQPDGDDAVRCAAWVVPGRHGSPMDALARIRFICANTPDLFTAVWIVLATHQGVDREKLAAALRQMRAELAAFSLEEIQGLLTSILHGGQPGFDAVMRARQRGKKSAAPTGSKLPWSS